MKSARRSKRYYRIQLAIAAAGLLTVAKANANVLFDNTTPAFANNFNNSLATIGVADTFEGLGYNLAAGSADIYGFDAFPYNATNYNGSSYTATFDHIKINVYVWGGVNSNPSSNSVTTPAFSNLLREVSTVIDYSGGGGLAPGYFGTPNGGNVSNYGSFVLNTPIVLPSVTVGVTINYQGSVDGGLTYNNVQGLTSLITTVNPPTVGSALFNGFYRNGATATDPTKEVNGNFVTGLHSFGVANQSGPMFRLYGDVGVLTPDKWTSAAGGTWSDGTKWSNGTPPTPGIDAIFNLSSPTPYTVTIPDLEYAANLRVQNDNVAFDLNTLNSFVAVTGALTVGQSATVGAATVGSLSLGNSGRITSDTTGLLVYAIVEAGSIAVGGNGGTGTLTTTPIVYLFADNDTSIGAGSSIVIGAGSNFSSYTLTIAGTTDGWTGKLDIGSSDIDLRNGSIGTVTNQLKTGLGNGSWNGNGITSSVAAADSKHLTAIGAVVNNDGTNHVLFGTNASRGTFDAQDTDPALNAVLLRYTYFGDANIDGKVDGTDYSRIDNGFIGHLTGWYNGDFNYDGVINGSDYTLIDNAYNNQGPSLANGPTGSPSVLATGIDTRLLLGGTGIDGVQALPINSITVTPTAQIAAPTATSSVPEPASMGLFAMAAIPMLRRRARRIR